jgi:hypothetical protein
MYWRPDEKAAGIAEKKLLNCGDSYRRIYYNDRVSLFRFNGSSGKIIDAPFDSAAVSKQDFTKAIHVEHNDLIESGIDGIYISDYKLNNSTVKRGDTLNFYVDWVTERKIHVGSYITYIRFDTNFRKGPLYSFYYGKIYRKIIEQIKGRRFRFRYDKLPFNGVNPPDRWEPFNTVRENFSISVPEDISAGVYVISIKMAHKTQYPNYTMKEIFTDDDFYNGADIAKVFVE